MACNRKTACRSCAISDARVLANTRVQPLAVIVLPKALRHGLTQCFSPSVEMGDVSVFYASAWASPPVSVCVRLCPARAPLLSQLVISRMGRHCEERHGMAAARTQRVHRVVPGEPQLWLLKHRLSWAAAALLLIRDLRHSPRAQRPVLLLEHGRNVPSGPRLVIGGPGDHVGDSDVEQLQVPPMSLVALHAAQ